MLESIRQKSSGPVAKVILSLIIIPFAFAGVYSYFNFDNTNAVAKVNGSDIGLAEFEQAYRMQQENWGENFDRFFNTDERLQQFRMNVLQQLINQRLSSQAISQMGLRASDKVLKQEIMNTPQFQDENGNFDLDLYQITIQSAGYTVNDYQNARKSDMATQQFFSAIDNTNFALDYELLRHQALEAQSRDIDYLVIQKSSLVENIDFSTEEGAAKIKEYYELNQSQFRIPEKIAIDYILINRSDFKDVTVDEDEITAYYDENVASFSGTERRKVAHILVNVPVDSDQSAIDRARAKIDAAKEALAEGQSFEQVVTEYSEDDISAEMGGELDWIEIGMMDTAFEDAAFALTDVNAVSDVVRSDFGFHIIKVLDIESGEPKSLDELRDEIVQQLKTDIADDRYLEAIDLLAEKAFEYSDSLKEAAAAIEQPVGQTPLFDRNLGIGLPEELRAFPQVIQSAFSDEVLLDELNSELLELDNDTAIVLRKREYQAEGVQPLEMVSSQIEQILIDQKASDRTQAIADQLMSKLQLGSSLDAIAMEFSTQLPDLKWTTQSGLKREGTEVDARIRDQAFGMAMGQAAQLSQTVLTNGDVAIIRLNQVNRPEPDQLTAVTHEQKFLQFHQQAEISGYIKKLDSEADIERLISNTEIIQ